MPEFTLLIVDDEPANLALPTRLLQPHLLGACRHFGQPLQGSRAATPDAQPDPPGGDDAGLDITEFKPSEAEIQRQVAKQQQQYDVMLGGEDRVLELKREAGTGDDAAIPPAGGRRP